MKSSYHAEGHFLQGWQSNYSFNLTSLILSDHICLTAAHTGCLGLLKIVTLRPTVMVHAPAQWLAQAPGRSARGWTGPSQPHYTTFSLLVKAILAPPLLNNRHHH